jgi:hypothetical protein
MLSVFMLSDINGKENQLYNNWHQEVVRMKTSGHLGRRDGRRRRCVRARRAGVIDHLESVL